MNNLSEVLKHTQALIGGDLQFLDRTGTHLLRGRIKEIRLEGDGVRIEFAWVVRGVLDTRSLVNKPEWVVHSQRGGHLVCPLFSVLERNPGGFFQCHYGGTSWSLFPRGHATVVNSAAVRGLILA